MKSFNLIVIVLVAAHFTLPMAARASTEPSTRTSIAGHVFTRVTNQPELGDAWADESGLIWGSVVEKSAVKQADLEKYCFNASNSAESRCQMNQSQAVAYCLSIGTRLPTRDQFVKLDKYLGESHSTMDINGNFLFGREKTEVIPGLANVTYWSATLSPDLPEQVAYVFGYGTDVALQLNDNDVINDYTLGGSSFTRCVK